MDTLLTSLILIPAMLAGAAMALTKAKRSAGLLILAIGLLVVLAAAATAVGNGIGQVIEGVLR